ncbi:MAG: hypothetical protein AABW61_01810 [Candidatus Aenigmatarchaeota archaeon]
MPNKKGSELIQLFGKRLVIGGFVLILAGVLWLYGVDWPIILIIIGAVLFVKGLIIKAKGKLI